MKLSVRMTLEGMLRALRSRAHGMAEDAEAGYSLDAASAVSAQRGERRAMPPASNRERGDERTGR